MTELSRSDQYGSTEPSAFGSAFFQRGWTRFPLDDDLARWLKGALPAARNAVRAPENGHWLRCGGTWFAGVNVLGNDASGRIDGGLPLSGTAMDFIHSELGLADIKLDQGQVSVCYPGYPRQSDGETDASFRFRRDRDAAHLDGLLPIGPDRRRHVCEHHAFVLGIPMADASPDAAPLVVWEGSHEIVRHAFSEWFAEIPIEQWSEVDVTERYQELRRTIFQTCRRCPVAARPGEAYLVHRLALHGVAPFPDTETAGPDGRMIVYFRPEFPAIGDWLSAP